MPVCQNPECGKEISENREFCDEKCHRRYYELKGEKQFQIVTALRVKELEVQPQVEAVLKFMGIEKTNLSKSVAYTHWGDSSNL